MSRKQDKDPREDMDKLNEAIKSGQIKNVHLLCGEEDYLRLQFRDKLVTACGGQPGSMNYDRFVGKETVPEKIIDLAETMPFFVDRRVILIEDSGWFKSGCEAMASYIEQGVCESTCLIFCEKETDAKTKLWKQVDKHGMISRFDTQNETTLRAWICSQMKRSGIEISGADSSYLINFVGFDMVRLSNELEKLTGYCLERGRATRSDIDAICSGQLENTVFAMVEACTMGRKNQAFDMYFNLMDHKGTPLGVLAVLTKQYELLLKVKDLLLRGRPSDELIGNKIGRLSWTVKGYKAQAARYSYHQLKNIVDRCLETDMDIKSGKIKDSVAVEELLVELSGGV